MKKVILILSIISIIFSVTSAQITIKQTDGTDINNGDIITFNTTEDEANLVTLITNNWSNSIDVRLVAETITGTNGSDMEFCIGVCYWGITEGHVYGPITINAGATTTESQVHFHNHSTESDIITYNFKIYEDGNESNAISFTYKYDVNYTGVNNISNSNISLYPNPATNYFTVKLKDELVGSQIVLTNLLGKVVLKQNINSLKQNFKTNNFGSGVYFYSIVKNNQTIATKKLIIK